MIYKLLTNIVVLVHLAFIVYVVLGGLLVLRWKKSIYIHILTAMWGVIVEYFDIICPLTPLENYFRTQIGTETYSTSFIDHYITLLIYPEYLNRNTQIFFGSFVIAINLIIYTIVYMKYKRKKLKT